MEEVEHLGGAFGSGVLGVLITALVAASTWAAPALEWQIDITASDGSGTPSTIIAGISDLAKTAADLLDDRQPPPPPLMQQPVRICFDHSDWSLWPGSYRLDVRPAADSMVFPLSVWTQNTGGEITLTFDLETVPENYSVSLHDKTNGESIFLEHNDSSHRREWQFIAKTENTAFDLVVLKIWSGVETSTWGALKSGIRSR